MMATAAAAPTAPTAPAAAAAPAAAPAPPAAAAAGGADNTCRACTDFQSWMRHQRAVLPDTLGKAKSASAVTAAPAVSGHGSPSVKPETSGHEFSNTADVKVEGTSTQASTESKEDSSTKQVSKDAEEAKVSFYGNAAKYGCPADSVSLGRGSWRLLHSMAAYYPTQPSSLEQDDMKTFISLFSKFYPCQPCAEDFREWLKTHSPAVESRGSLSRWLCDAHNEMGSSSCSSETVRIVAAATAVTLAEPTRTMKQHQLLTDQAATKASQGNVGI
nr:uncharacterized protein LOC128704325 isoform X1 [Cherax quadricarinatus]